MFNEAPKTIASFARGYNVRGVNESPCCWDVQWSALSDSELRSQSATPASRAAIKSVGLCERVTRNIQTNLSELVGKAQHVINRLQVSQSTSLRISFTSCRKAMASAWSQKMSLFHTLKSEQSAVMHRGKCDMVEWGDGGGEMYQHFSIKQMECWRVGL